MTRETVAGLLEELRDKWLLRNWKGNVAWGECANELTALLPRISKLIGEAVAAERERCAKIAESSSFDPDDDEYFVKPIVTCKMIAARIRQPREGT